MGGTSTCRALTSRTPSTVRATSMASSIAAVPSRVTTPLLASTVMRYLRVSGWPAHVLEQDAHHRLIRPRAEYIGPEYPQRYTALDAR